MCECIEQSVRQRNNATMADNRRQERVYPQFFEGIFFRWLSHLILLSHLLSSAHFRTRKGDVNVRTIGTTTAENEKKIAQRDASTERRTQRTIRDQYVFFCFTLCALYDLARSSTPEVAVVSCSRRSRKRAAASTRSCGGCGHCSRITAPL